MGFFKDKPYNELPLLPPEGVQLDSRMVLQQALKAGRVLAELKTAGLLIPNQSVLLSTLGLQEAQFSSEIENIVTTQDALYRASADVVQESDLATKEILSYNKALWHGYATLKKNRPIGTNLIEELVSIIKPGTGGVRKIPGTKIATVTGQTIYTPPEGEQVIRDKLANLEHFYYNHEEIDPLIRMAVAHYQFEAIHPFSDGNGRTGRILNILFLVEAGLLGVPILYLSSYIVKHKAEYYASLRRVTEENAWEDWILYMLRAVEETAKTTYQKIMLIQQRMEEYGDKVKLRLPKLYRKELVELLFSQPYCKIQFLVDAGMGNRLTATKYLNQLTEAGFLKKEKYGRDLYYRNQTFLDVLNQ